MAETRKACVSYQGDGIHTEYSFPFDYLRKAFVKVEYVSGGERTPLTQGTDYTVNDRTVVLKNPTTLIINIYRETTTGPIVSWEDASVLRAKDMTLQQIQMLHLAEETDDKVQENGMALNSEGDWDGRFHKITNVISPDIDDPRPNDVMTVYYYDKVKGSTLSYKWAVSEESPDAGLDSESPTGNTMSSRSWSIQAKKWAEAPDSPDDEEDEESLTGDTMSSKEWAKYARQIAVNLKNPVVSVAEKDGKVTVTQADETTNTFYAGLNILSRNKEYKVGDIAYSSSLPSWAYLECVTAGTTGAKEPDFSAVTGGGLIDDGTVRWETKDIRVNTLVDLLYPVGTVIAVANNNTPAFTKYGTWEKIGSGRVLWGADSSHSAGSTIAAGIPNITGTFEIGSLNAGASNSTTFKSSLSGAFSGSYTESAYVLNQKAHGADNKVVVSMSASESNSIYGQSTTVQPPAYVVNFWERTA